MMLMLPPLLLLLLLHVQGSGLCRGVAAAVEGV
jgi:hypothetical protein